MKRAIFIHGYYDKEKYYDPETDLINFKNYTPWLLKQLTTKDYLVYAPLMPKPFFPTYEKWKRELERYDLDEDMVLIGKSFGGGFLLRWLSETDKKVGKVFLVAPYINQEQDNVSDDLKMPFFNDFKLDRDLAKKTNGLTIFQSTDDGENIKKSREFIKKNVDNFREIMLKNRGHFTISTAGEINRTFPELLEEILK
ncbi:alpha/beta hydrolase [Candidatus Saccharibacteria bacterium]|nr:alpha/beta hydrolase [Candidatus Saccharibacteria bacterium]